MLSFSHFQGKASKRKQVLDEAYGQQGFLADSRDLVNVSHYSHHWNALSFICNEWNRVIFPLVLSFEMCCQPNMSPYILRCFDPETVGATQKGHLGPFWDTDDLGYLPFTVGNRKFRLENQMLCAIPFGSFSKCGLSLKKMHFFTL